MLNNPNNCETCEHKKHPDGGHCYMFRNEPTDVCKIHSPYNIGNLVENLADIFSGANHAE